MHKSNFRRFTGNNVLSKYQHYGLVLVVVATGLIMQMTFLGPADSKVSTSTSADESIKPPAQQISVSSQPQQTLEPVKVNKESKQADTAPEPQSNGRSTVNQAPYKKLHKNLQSPDQSVASLQGGSRAKPKPSKHSKTDKRNH